MYFAKANRDTNIHVPSKIMKGKKWMRTLEAQASPAPTVLNSI